MMKIIGYKKLYYLIIFKIQYKIKDNNLSKWKKSPKFKLNKISTSLANILFCIFFNFQ